MTIEYMIWPTICRPRKIVQIMQTCSRFPSSPLKVCSTRRRSEAPHVPPRGHRQARSHRASAPPFPPQLFAEACRAVAAGPTRVPARKVQALTARALADRQLHVHIETLRGLNHEPNPPAGVTQVHPQCTAMRVPVRKTGAGTHENQRRDDSDAATKA